MDGASSTSINTILRRVIAKVQVAGVLLILFLVGLSLYINLRSANRSACKMIEAEFAAISGPLSRELALGDKTTSSAILSNFILQLERFGDSKNSQLLEHINSDTLRDKIGCSPGLFLLSLNFPVVFGEKPIAYVRGSVEQLSPLKVLLWLFVVIFGFVFAVRQLAKALEKHLKNLVIDPISSISNNSSLPDIRQYPDEVRTIEENIRRLKLDILEKERMNFELKKNKALGDLATEVAHDIRSPLAALTCVVRTANLPEEHNRLLQSAADRIKEITNTLLDTNKRLLHAGNLELLDERSLSTYSIAELIELVIREKQTETSSSKFNIVFQPAQSFLPFAKIEPVLFKRVISNLLNNSIEALSDHGKIILNLERRGANLVISIEDTGKGIPKEVLPTLSQRGVSFAKEHGSGIGLYQAKKAVHSWNGTFEISSELGSGTKVEILLPLVEKKD